MWSLLRQQQPQKPQTQQQQKGGLGHAPAPAASSEDGLVRGSDPTHDMPKQNLAELASALNERETNLREAGDTFAQEMRGRTDAILARESALLEREATCIQVGDRRRHVLS